MRKPLDKQANCNLGLVEICLARDGIIQYQSPTLDGLKGVSYYIVDGFYETNLLYFAAFNVDKCGERYLALW